MADKKIFFNRELVQNTRDNVGVFLRKRLRALAEDVVNYSKDQFSLINKDLYIQ